MDNDISLVNLGKLSPAVVKLITSVEKGIGGIFKPIQIKRVAKAKAAAMLIDTEANIRKEELIARANARLAATEARRQENIEAIVTKATKVIQQLPYDATDTPVNQDWIAAFFEDCKDIGEDKIQELWGKILAGEVVSPGTFSRRTLQALKTLETEDVEAFKVFCSVSMTHSDTSHKRFVLSPKRNAGKVKMMQEILVSAGLLESGDVEINIDEDFKYFGHDVWLDQKTPEGNCRKVHLRHFTRVGNQLFNIADPSLDWELMKGACGYLESEGIEVTFREEKLKDECPFGL